MKREELIAKGYTEEQVTDILDMYHEQEKVVKDANAKLTESKTLAQSLQNQLDEINKANMSEQEKMETMRKETEKNYAESRKVYNKAKVKEVLAGYEVEDELIDSLVTDDETTSLTSANMLKTRLDTIIANTTKKVQDNIASLDVKPNASNVPQDAGMTFDKFADLSAAEQERFIVEHPNEYQELIK